MMKRGAFLRPDPAAFDATNHLQLCRQMRFQQHCVFVGQNWPTRRSDSDLPVDE